MKKIRTINILLIFMVLGAISASAQKLFVSSIAPKGTTHLSVASTDSIVNIVNNGGTRTINVSSNLDYKIGATPNWCNVSKADNGNLNIVLEVNANPSVRSTDLMLTAKDNKKVKIAVNQLGTDAGALVKEKSIVLLDNKTLFGLEITNNVNVDLEMPAWITKTNDPSSTGTSRYLFAATPLTEITTRSGDIVVKGKNGEFAAITIPVSQTFNGLPRFAVISDVHFGNNEGVGPMVKVPNALKNLMAKTPLVDALFVCGDLTDWGQPGQYDQFISVFSNKANLPQNVKPYYLMGNHDHYADNALDNYKKLGQPFYQYVDIKGYPFITLSMNGTGANDYNTEALTFLSNSMKDAAAKYPGKPIFVFTHVPPANTIYSTNPAEGSWGTTRFDAILEKYPQAVIFSGHSHYPMGDPRSIHQKKFTTVNTGSTTYSEVESGVVSEGIHPAAYDNITEGLIVTVDENNDVNLERWDTYNNEKIGPDWVVKAPHDGTNFTYANRTGGEKPEFAANATVVVSDVQAESCKVTFPQGTDDEVVHRYVIELVDEEGIAECIYKKFSEFYLNSKMPLTFTINFVGVPTGATLKARVKAIDSYNQESEPIFSESFSTNEYVPAPGSKKPEADLIDVSFGAGGVAIDNSPLKHTVKVGSSIPTTFEDELTGKWAASFTGSGSSFFRVDYAQQTPIKEAFSNGFTYETLYMPNNTNNICPMSAQESGGAGIEQATGGQLKFYAYVGGGYKVLNSSVTAVPGKYYHVVASYDKAAQKIRMYVNGMLAGETEAAGNFSIPGNSNAQWVAIGGDAGVGENAQYSLNGNVVFARMYGKAVTRDEVYWLYKDTEYKPSPEVEKPTADLFEIVFGANGEATDVSPLNVALERGSTLPQTYQKEGSDSWIAKFPKSGSCYYKVDYSKYPAIKSALANGFTFETVYKPNITADMCPMSGQESGGTGIEQSSTGEIQFYAHINGDYKVVNSGVTAIPGREYHVLAVYDKAKGQLRMYVNGQSAGQLTVSGDFDYPSQEAAHWIAIGGDANKTGDGTQYTLDGEVRVARMYSKPLSRAEAFILYESVK